MTTAPHTPTVTRPAYFEVAKDGQGKWHWTLWSGNGRQMAICVMGYDQRSDCTDAIKTVKNAVAAATRVVIAHEA